MEIKKALEEYAKASHNQKFKNEVNRIGDYGLKALLDSALTHKAEIIDILRKSPKWREDKLAVIDEISIPRNFDKVKFDNLIEEFIDYIMDSGIRNKYDIPLRNILRGISGKFLTDTLLVKNCLSDIYHEGEKPSRLLMKFCKELGANKEDWFDKWYARISDMLSKRHIKRIVYLSVNPAHILTMSNPKHVENRSLVSCQSLDNTDYCYRAGNSGLATDSSTMILFTVKEEKDEYTNKKDRKLYHFDGINLLANRLYTSLGGIEGHSDLNDYFNDWVIHILSQSMGIGENWLERDSEEQNSFFPSSDYYGYTDYNYPDDNEIHLFSAQIENPHKEGGTETGSTSICLNCGRHINKGILCSTCAGTFTCFECNRELPIAQRRILNISDSVEYICRECGRRFYNYNEETGEYEY